jgi:glyoxylase-like metal-dependent hydrolase (beta-lactamase superfamily II)
LCVYLDQVIISFFSFILMSYQQVKDKVTIAVNEYGSNLVCLELEDELVFIDAGLLTSYTTEFKSSMETRTGKSTSTLIMTHAHLDHLLGMHAFRDCDVVAAEASKLRFERFVNLEYTEEVIQDRERVFPHFREATAQAELRMPTTLVEDTLTVGNDEILFKVEGGHSAGSSSIYYKTDKVIVAGDLVQAERYPYFGEPDTDLGKWIGTLETWESSDIIHVLPGHGPVVTRGYLSCIRTFFQNMLTSIKQLKEHGVAIEDVIYHPDLPSGYWPRDAERKPAYDYSIKTLYHHL